jgi:hypothetical protein
VNAQAPRAAIAAIAAIEFAIRDDAPREFLNAWLHGDFDVIQREWPEVPKEVFAAMVTPETAQVLAEQHRAPKDYTVEQLRAAFCRYLGREATNSDKDLTAAFVFASGFRAGFSLGMDRDEDLRASGVYTGGFQAGVDLAKTKARANQTGAPSAPLAKTIALPEHITVADLAYRLSVKISVVLTELLRGGCSATVSQALDREAAEFVAHGLGWQVRPAQGDESAEATGEPACECRVRPAHQCPGAWEPGCDLGSNPQFARVASPQASDAVDAALSLQRAKDQA